MQARIYVDKKCVFHGKPMIDSGTLGTKGNTQCVLPFLSESYGSSRDPPEEGIPVCTLKNFPNQIDHTIAWARDKFEGNFVNAPQEALNYLTNDAYLTELAKQPNTEKQNLETVLAGLVDHRPKDMADCVTWARLQFEADYANQIKQLLAVYSPPSLLAPSDFAVCALCVLPCTLASRGLICSRDLYMFTRGVCVCVC